MIGDFWGQSIRYLLVGCIIYMVDLGTFAVIITGSSGRYYLLANLAAKAVAAALGFALHKTVTFTWRQQDPAAVQSLLYCTLLLFNLGLSTLLLYVLIGLLAQPELSSRIAVDVGVTGFSFLVSRGLVFRPEKSRGKKPDATFSRFPLSRERGGNLSC
jgi:putative flippase GtrA